jgi:hypothetical protein
MKIIELVTFNRELLSKIKAAGIHFDDCMYIDLYNEYNTMRKNGEKVTYTVAVLSEKYHISERKVYYLIRRLNSDCKSFAAENTHK